MSETPDLLSLLGLNIDEAPAPTTAPPPNAFDALPPPSLEYFNVPGSPTPESETTNNQAGNSSDSVLRKFEISKENAKDEELSPEEILKRAMAQMDPALRHNIELVKKTEFPPQILKPNRLYDITTFSTNYNPNVQCDLTPIGACLSHAEVLLKHASPNLSDHFVANAIATLRKYSYTDAKAYASNSHSGTKRPKKKQKKMSRNQKMLTRSLHLVDSAPHFVTIYCTPELQSAFRFVEFFPHTLSNYYPINVCKRCYEYYVKFLNQEAKIHKLSEKLARQYNQFPSTPTKEPHSPFSPGASIPSPTSTAAAQERLEKILRVKQQETTILQQIASLQPRDSLSSTVKKYVKLKFSPLVETFWKLSSLQDYSSSITICSMIVVELEAMHKSFMQMNVNSSFETFPLFLPIFFLRKNIDKIPRRDEREMVERLYNYIMSQYFLRRSQTSRHVQRMLFEITDLLIQATSQSTQLLFQVSLIDTIRRILGKLLQDIKFRAKNKSISRMEALDHVHPVMLNMFASLVLLLPDTPETTLPCEMNEQSAERAIDGGTYTLVNDGIRYITKALETLPCVYDNYAVMTQLYLRIGMVEEATTKLQDYVEKCPRDPHAKILLQAFRDKYVIKRNVEATVFKRKKKTKQQTPTQWVYPIQEAQHEIISHCKSVLALDMLNHECLEKLYNTAKDIVSNKQAPSSTTSSLRNFDMDQMVTILNLFTKAIEACQDDVRIWHLLIKFLLTFKNYQTSTAPGESFLDQVRKQVKSILSSTDDKDSRVVNSNLLIESIYSSAIHDSRFIMNFIVQDESSIDEEEEEHIDGSTLPEYKQYTMLIGYKIIFLLLLIPTQYLFSLSRKLTCTDLITAYSEKVSHEALFLRHLLHFQILLKDMFPTELKLNLKADGKKFMEKKQRRPRKSEHYLLNDKIQNLVLEDEQEE